jgi:hypothetical protein
MVHMILAMMLYRMQLYPSVTEAADAIGIGRSTLSAHETGQTNFRAIRPSSTAERSESKWIGS